MQLRYDPYGIFQNSKSPAGLYARQKWLGEFEDPTWKTDFEEVVGALSKSLENSETGWRGIITNIDTLFGLHLTQRASDAEIDSALDGLMDKISLQGDGIKIETGGGSMDNDLKNLPFVNSQPDMLLLSATLFLATIFGRGSDPDVTNLFEWLDKKDPELLRRYLTDYSVSHAEQVVDRWRQLGEFLVTKYNDGYVKNEKGRPEEVGYPEPWLRDVLRLRPGQFELKRWGGDSLKTDLPY